MHEIRALPVLLVRFVSDNPNCAGVSWKSLILQETRDVLLCTPHSPHHHNSGGGVGPLHSCGGERNRKTAAPAPSDSMRVKRNDDRAAAVRRLVGQAQSAQRLAPQPSTSSHGPDCHAADQHQCSAGPDRGLVEMIAHEQACAAARRPRMSFAGTSPGAAAGVGAPTRRRLRERCAPSMAGPGSVKTRPTHSLFGSMPRRSCIAAAAAPARCSRWDKKAARLCRIRPLRAVSRYRWFASFPDRQGPSQPLSLHAFLNRPCRRARSPAKLGGERSFALRGVGRRGSAGSRHPLPQATQAMLLVLVRMLIAGSLRRSTMPTYTPGLYLGWNA
jgi:hypothetical protein